MTRVARLMVLAMVAAFPVNAQTAPQERMHLVWSDEFSGSRIDRDKWRFDVDCWGGGNNERQCYTDRLKNAHVRDGKLIIVALRENISGPSLPQDQHDEGKPATLVEREFSSARLTTRGKASWRYGRVEIRAKLPGGQGSWPAFWMLPEHDRYGTWAASGEIDIMEAVNLDVACPSCNGGRENRIYGTIHFGGPPPHNRYISGQTILAGATRDFHVCSIDWLPDRITWSIDNKPYVTRRRGEWETAGSTDPSAPFDHPFYLLLNLAVGGNMAESAGGFDQRAYPQQMEIDWVRVWQRTPAIDAP